MYSNHSTRSNSTHARHVERKLAKIQNANRLVLHTFEGDDESLLVPEKLLRDLQHNAPLLSKPLTRDMEKAEVALVSTISVPPRTSGRAGRPFDMLGIGAPIGYLFNLDAEQPNPPAVVRAMETSRFTDYNNRRKRLYLFQDTIPPALESLYKPFVHDTECPNDDGGSYYEIIDRTAPKKEQQLINAAFRNRKQYATALDVVQKMHLEDPALQWSEIMAAASSEHIAALVLPLDEHSCKTTKDDKSRFIDSSGRFTAALSGLAHLQQGIDIPLVSYETHGRHKGRITYLAQGKDELRALALTALNEIQENPESFCKFAKKIMPFSRTDDLDDAARALLGVEIQRPLAEQGITFGRKSRKV